MTPEPTPHPRLRTLSIDTHDGGYIFRDPHGEPNEAIWLSPAAALAATLFDGTRDVDMVAAELGRQAGGEVGRERIEAILAALVEAGFLDTPAARERVAAREAAYLACGLRPMALAGQCFPADEGEFEAMLADFLTASGRPPATTPLTGLVLPHLDLRRVPQVYGAAIAALAATPAPTRLLVVGVAHSAIAEVAAALPLDLETPMGRLEVDHEALQALTAALPFPLLNSPMAFRHEHSIEFPAALLHGLWPDSAMKIIPLVVGGVQAADELAALRAALRALALSHPFFPVASVDLSHVGGRFGDAPLEPHTTEATEAIDGGYLAAIAARRFDAAFQGLVGAGNPTRIDAYASVHALSDVLPGQGEVLAYCLSPEPETGSAVGAGAIAFR